jgi:hypothetical protein
MNAPRRLVMRVKAHQGHRLDDAQPSLQAPAQHLAVACRKQETRLREFRRRADQGFQVFVALPNRVAEEADPCRVAGDAPIVLDYGRGPLPYSLEQLRSPVETLNLEGQLVTCLEVLYGRRASVMHGYSLPDGWSLEVRERLARVEPEFGVER